MGEASFGKYRLIAELGHGGMADVFLAVMRGPEGSGFSKLTVIKRLRQNLADEPEFVEMLVDEARISARLNHPNVVQTNEVGSVGDQYFLAMEYLDGQPFHRIQHRAVQFAQKAAAASANTATVAPAGDEPPLSNVLPTDPFPKACQYLVLLDTLAGLHHAHELADYDGSPLQIVHRDVTPHNVFVTYEGQVKVVDFGIAKAAGRASETRQGVVKGKVRYMAPEQAIGQPVDRRADVFSVGVMLWEAATGRRLWKGMDDLNIVQALVEGSIKSSPREIDPNVPEELDRICRRALAHSRDERYATAEDFRLDLEQHLAESGTLVSARRKLGPAVSALFSDKRSEIKGVIEKQLQKLKGRSLMELKAVEVPVDTSSSSIVVIAPSSAGTAVVRDDNSHDVTSIEGASAQLPTASAKSRLPMLLAGGAAAVAIGVLALTRLSSPPAAARPSTPTPTSTSNADTTVRDVRVRVKLTVAPAAAQITIDGAPVPSPYDADVPRDNHDHLIRVDAAGFDPQVETVRFEGDVTRTFTLSKPVATRGTAASGARTPSAASAGRWVPPAVANARLSHEPPPPVAPVSGPPVVPTAKAPKPNIDKDDPWATH